jgi:hypothetical protein
MCRASRSIVLALTAIVAAASMAAPQQPRISNGQLTTQALAAPFVQSFQALVTSQPDVTWIGYQVPAIRRDGIMCCVNSGTTWVSGTFVGTHDSGCCSACRIEPGASAAEPAASTAPQGPVKLEGPDTLVVLFRVVDRRVERIRMFSEGCELDAGGRPVRWLEPVRSADSVALLETFMPPGVERRDRIANSAISALAMHAGPEAGAAVQRLATAHTSGTIRGEALFWIAQRGEPSAEGIILQALAKDTSAAVRKRAVFALSQLRDEAAAVQSLLRVARTDATPSLRGEAIFWLGQKAGRKAAADITERIEQDPDTDVKKRAVFALSQLPKDEGVPLLIQVARNNPNPAVKKQAMFWLGQSKDPRAIEFFAEILK